MDFRAFLATLSAALPKSLSDAKQILSDAAVALTAAIAELDLKITALSQAERDLATARADLEARKGELATATQTIETLRGEVASVNATAMSALSAAGIKAEKFEVESIKAAAAARAETLSHELLAARGLKPLPENVKESGSAPDAALTTDEAIFAKYDSMPIGNARQDFLAQHRDAIWRHHSKIQKASTSA